MNNNYTITAASRLSGVSELVIRAWENRYNAVEPVRTDTNRRLYSEQDINKLTLLGKLTKAGHRIGTIANLPVHDLVRMNGNSGNRIPAENDTSPNYFIIINECIEAIRYFDNRKFEKFLFRASVEYSHPELLEKVIIPLMERVGDFWRDGILKVSHEHFASALVKKFLNNLSDGYNIDKNVPSIIVTTPQGQLHEIGALIGASFATAEGWRVIYLGPSLPAEEIISALKETDSKALYLSMAYPSDDPVLVTELQKLKKGLENVHLFAAGKAVEGYRDILQEIKAVFVDDYETFRESLLNIRKGKIFDEKENI